MSTKITPFLWFNDQAEEAAKFYTSIFRNSKIGAIARYGEDGPGPKGSVMTVSFQLDGQEFTALNGGPHFTFSPAISFVVHCETQKEVDEYWDKLSAGGKTEQCGWLRDRYDVSCCAWSTAKRTSWRRWTTTSRSASSRAPAPGTRSCDMERTHLRPTRRRERWPDT